MSDKTQQKITNDLFGNEEQELEKLLKNDEPQTKKPVMPMEMVAKSAKTREILDFHEIELATEKRKNISTAESLQMEKEKPANAIYLFNRGSFLRAYNGSAWLFHTLFKEYKVLSDKLLKAEKYIYIGFPADKLSDLIGKDGEIDERDAYTVVTVPDEAISAIPPYEKWLKMVKISEKKETDLPMDSHLPTMGTSVRITNAYDVALRLATYHMERHTMIENMQFLSELIESIRYDDGTV